MTKIDGCKCLRCGYEWKPHAKVIRVCAGCHSPYWNVAPKNKNARKI